MGAKTSSIFFKKIAACTTAIGRERIDDASIGVKNWAKEEGYEEPEIVYMKNMYVILYLSDNRIVEITSLKGRYNKENYNCYFEEDVVATDGDIRITAKNLDLLATENIIKAYDSVNLNHATGSLQADKVNYDFDTKNFKVSMYNDESIKIKLIQ